MAFREVRVYEIKEVLRLWLRGTGTRKIAALVGLDRKTVQRYIAAATQAGLERGTGEDSLDDALMAQVCGSAPGPVVAMGTANRGQLSRPTMTS